MSALVVRGASVWRDGAWQPHDLVCRGGWLVADTDAPVLDAAGLLAAPGLIDLQCNGALGIDLAREPERMWELAAELPRWGVTAWLPTIVTSPPGIVDRALAALAAGPPPGWAGATPLGLHLEGPFLAPAKRGAHPESLLQSPSLAAIEGWSRDAGVTVVTIAPELAGASEIIEALVARGVIVSLGHSAATAAEARAGVDAGATWVTHLFNAMSPLHHREPGLAGVALNDERLRVGLIADGIHVDPAVVATAQRALGDRLTLVTDAVGALGLPEGSSSLGGGGTTTGRNGVRLADGTLAGASVGMDHAVRNLVEFARCNPATALSAASAAPAALLGDAHRGSLVTGSRADVVLLSESLDVVMTIVAGEVVHNARDGTPRPRS
ncbi:MAG: N-acetylglucosamine-6-phosphate deacetylase [Microthrixaceae bacterium]